MEACNDRFQAVRGTGSFLVRNNIHNGKNSDRKSVPEVLSITNQAGNVSFAGMSRISSFQE